MELEIALANSEDSVCYHGTSLYVLRDILAHDKFLMSHASNLADEEHQTGQAYFLSVRRLPSSSDHYECTLALNAARLNSRLKRSSVNYWGQEAIHQKNEIEDRYLSKKEVLDKFTPLIKEVHIFSGYTKIGMYKDVLISLKKKGIKTFVYKDAKAYRLLDKRRTVKSTDIILKGDFIKLSEKPLTTYFPKRGKSELDFLVSVLYSKKLDLDLFDHYYVDSYRDVVYAHDPASKLRSTLQGAARANKVAKLKAARILNYKAKHQLDYRELAYLISNTVRRARGIAEIPYVKPVVEVNTNALAQQAMVFSDTGRGKGVSPIKVSADFDRGDFMDFIRNFHAPSLGKVLEILFNNDLAWAEYIPYSSFDSHDFDKLTRLPDLIDNPFFHYVKEHGDSKYREGVERYTEFMVGLFKGSYSYDRIKHDITPQQLRIRLDDFVEYAEKIDYKLSDYLIDYVDNADR